MTDFITKKLAEFDKKWKKGKFICGNSHEPSFVQIGNWLTTTLEEVAEWASDIGYCDAADKCDSHSMEFIKQMEKAKKQAKRESIEQAIACLPELGIKWMQEGYKKERKGFTDGYNQATTKMRDKLQKLKL